MAVLVAATLTTAACGSESSGSTSSAATAAPRGQMVLATTTSTRDTGLLDALVPAFEHTGKCSVKTVAVGSGQAMDLGARGQADVLLVHSPDAEQTFMAQGHGASRLAVHEPIRRRRPAPAGLSPRCRPSRTRGRRLRRVLTTRAPTPRS